MLYLINFSLDQTRDTNDCAIVDLTNVEVGNVIAVRNAVRKSDAAFAGEYVYLKSITPITTPAPQQTIRTIEFAGGIIPVNRILWYKKGNDLSSGRPCIDIRLDNGDKLTQIYFDTIPGGCPAEINRNIAFNELHRNYTTGK